MKPTLSELEKFEDQPEGIDLEVVTEASGKHSWGLFVCATLAVYQSEILKVLLEKNE